MERQIGSKVPSHRPASARSTATTARALSRLASLLKGPSLAGWSVTYGEVGGYSNLTGLAGSMSVT
jgi:hypothetical protein